MVASPSAIVRTYPADYSMQLSTSVFPHQLPSCVPPTPVPEPSDQAGRHQPRLGPPPPGQKRGFWPSPEEHSYTGMCESWEPLTITKQC